MGPNKKIMAEINITPFTDVVLVLLIIFMIITPLIYENNVKINLPTTTTREVDEKPQKIIVQVSESGDYYLDKQKFSSTNEREMNNLSAAVASRNTGESTMIIRGDKNTRYQLIMQIIDIAKKANFKRVVLAGEIKK